MRKMTRTYSQWYSPALHKNMEMLTFGYAGASVLFLPARMGRFYDYENWRIIDVLRPKLEHGHLQIYCVDSIDLETFYSPHANSSQKILRHLQYERYLMEEVVPVMRQNNPGGFMMIAGCSLGAYHAVNLALKYPESFNKVVAMSGRYDLTQQVGHYEDLLRGFWDENIYFNMPTQYLANLTDKDQLQRLTHLEIVLAVGRADVVLPSNQLLHELLTSRGINSTLHLWDDEAHRAGAWRKMANVYL